MTDTPPPVTATLQPPAHCLTAVIFHLDLRLFRFDEIRAENDIPEPGNP